MGNLNTAGTIHVWSGVIAVVVLLISYGIAVGKIYNKISFGGKKFNYTLFGTLIVAVILLGISVVAGFYTKPESETDKDE